MVITITGGSSSGKSAMAEEIAMRLTPGEKEYIATMIRSSQAEDPIIARHRKLREGKHFRTWECPLHPETLGIPENATVLLECVANLLANEMFCADADAAPAAERVLNSIRALSKKCGILLLITNEVFSDGMTYQDGTADYIRALGTVNRGLMELSDTYVESVYGIPYLLKGELV